MWLVIICLFIKIVSNWRNSKNSGNISRQIFKQFAIILFLIVLSFSAVQAQSFSIKGKINCSEEGTLYLFLVDKHSFKIPFTGIDTLVIKPESGIDSVSFEFKNVQKGKYGIRGFLDKNENEKLDKGLFGPSEPWVISWQDGRCFPFDFEDIAFLLDADIYIKLKLN